MYWEVVPTPVILYGSRPVTKHKKKSYYYKLLLMIVNILCYKCNIIVYKCNVPRETTTQSTNVNKRGKEKRNSRGQRNTNVTPQRSKKDTNVNRGTKAHQKKHKGDKGQRGT